MGAARFKAHPLYCRNAQVLLSPEQNQQVHRFRQALYLYFINLDSRWVEHVLEDPHAITELSRLTFLGQVTVNPADRQQGIDAVRNELIPLLIKVENKDPDVQSFSPTTDVSWWSTQLRIPTSRVRGCPPT